MLCGWQIIKQMWPFIGKYVTKMLKTTVEPDVNKQLPSHLTPFVFQKIDLGFVVSEYFHSYNFN